ncbi:FMN-dependent NADH-azoreductase [Chroococcidiopsis thermalis]|uniref:FMN dependent NADH:quinone oxidoreductase n=1 Tax=Chroococcidiopsis thermalis (strain PCC 7203) TaxID=251229 RepID=K9U996_CHRTP|nr:NAD(P)H-dependent oxidoreductase [Chroococcidiopsis thermalis]AFY91021.1 NAD(P)H dehydrogenase (quinone) [Chroococcidiopsis thermalis PCC 7203]
MKLLEVQSSVRLERSVSRSLSHEFVQAWQMNHSHAQHKMRDVGTNPPAHPTELWTQANYTPPEARTLEMVGVLSHSEQLIAELLWADCLLLGVPMYNLSVPSNFKAYLDNVVRVDRTFAFDCETFTLQGLATGKKALVITPSAGDYAPGTPMAKFDFCEPYLRAILEFIGIADVTVITVPNQFMPDEIRHQQIETARTKLMALAATW